MSRLVPSGQVGTGQVWVELLRAAQVSGAHPTTTAAQCCGRIWEEEAMIRG